MPRTNPDLKNIASASQFLSMVVFVGILFVARDILIPLALGVLIAFLLTPIVNRLQRWGSSNVVAVCITSGLVFGTIALSIMLLVSNLTQLSADIPRYQGELSKKVATVREYAREITTKFARITAKLSSSDSMASTTSPKEENADSTDTSLEDEGATSRNLEVKPGASAIAARGVSPNEPVYVQIASDSMLTIRSWAGSAGAILGPIGTLGLVLVFAVFLLIYRDDLRDRFIASISHGNDVVSSEALQDASSRISRYLIAQFLLNVSYGLLFALGLMLIGYFLAQDGKFPNALLLGGFAGLFRFIPYAGPLIGAAIPILVSIAIFPGYQVVVAVIVMIIAMELLSNNIVEPLVYGSRTGVSSIAVIMAAVFWGSLWGPVGLLLATPLTVCLVVLGMYVPRFKYLATMLSDSQQVEPSLRVFQRLISEDSHKLRELLEAEKSDRAVDVFFDEIVVPTCRRVIRSAASTSIDDLQLIECLSAGIDEADVYEEKGNKPTNDEPNGSSSTALIDEQSPRPICYAIAVNPGADQLILRGIAHLQSQVWEIRVVSAAEYPDDVAVEIAENNPQLVLIASMRLQGRQLRYWCKSLRNAKFTSTITVLLPGRLRDYDRVFTLLRKAGANYVMTSVRQTTRRMQLQAENKHPH